MFFRGIGGTIPKHVSREREVYFKKKWHRAESAGKENCILKRNGIEQRVAVKKSHVTDSNFFEPFSLQLLNFYSTISHNILMKMLGTTIKANPRGHPFVSDSFITTPKEL